MNTNLVMHACKCAWRESNMCC